MAATSAVTNPINTDDGILVLANDVGLNQSLQSILASYRPFIATSWNRLSFDATKGRCIAVVDVSSGSDFTADHVRLLRESGAALQALAITDSEEQQIAALRAGARCCMAKPISTKLLLAHVESALASTADSSQESPGLDDLLAGLSLSELEKRAIVATLAACNGNKAKTARVLGISEKSIYNKMKRHRLGKPANGK